MKPPGMKSMYRSKRPRGPRKAPAAREPLTPAELTIVERIARTPMRPNTFDYKFMVDMVKIRREAGDGMALTRKQRQMIWRITWRKRASIDNVSEVAAVMSVAESYDFSVGEAEAATRSGRDRDKPQEPPADKLAPAIRRIAAGSGELHRTPRGWAGPPGAPFNQAVINGLAARGWINLIQPDHFTGGGRAQRAVITARGHAEAQRLIEIDNPPPDRTPPAE